jgi:hypothetical protein
MERGVGMASSNPLGGSNFRESLPIGIKFYPAITVLSPGSGYGNILIKLSDSKLWMRKVEEVLAVNFGSIENYYKTTLDKESHCNKKVTVTVLHSQKIPILIDI